MTGRSSLRASDAVRQLATRTTCVVVLLSSACTPHRAGPGTSSANPVAASSDGPAGDARACGGAGCTLYDTPAAAFRSVLERKPRVLAVGEAHAQKAIVGAPSSVKRFTETMLPELAGKASDLILELMVPPSGCETKTAAVNKEMKKVTAPQAETNQNEYVTLGDAAQKLGIDPHLIHPTCDDFKTITAKDADPTDVSLRLIARLLREAAARALARNDSRGVDKIVVIYGGALHNDAEPPAALADYAYGPALAALTKGRYVELDVFVPEFVRDNGLWTKLAWYPHFDRRAHPDKATMFSTSPASFTILLPATPDARREDPCPDGVPCRGSCPDGVPCRGSCPDGVPCRGSCPDGVPCRGPERGSGGLPQREDAVTPP